MKKLLILGLLVLIYSCVDTTFEVKKPSMIKPSIFNAINFSDDFNRESKFFDPSLQRVANVISSTPSSSYVSFYFQPDSMPETTPDAELRAYFMINGFYSSIAASRTIELTNGYIFFFDLNEISPTVSEIYCRLMVDGYDDVLYSERCNFVLMAELEENDIVTLVAWNNDETHGYVSATYPACGFFEVSEFNNKVFGNEKLEYSYSYGRKKILRSENFIKTRLTFCNLSQYQQNLLKTLCNCENLTINGTSYYLISDFTERNKNDENEICDLQAEFIEVTQSFFVSGSSETPSNINQFNLFTK